jgi:hypothetical protein
LTLFLGKQLAFLKVVILIFSQYDNYIYIMAIVTRRIRQQQTATTQLQSQIIQEFRAALAHNPTLGQPQLWSVGDLVTLKVDYQNGIPVESYWNLSADPNVQIPNADFLAAQLLGNFVLSGTPNAPEIKRSRLANFVTLTETPQTIAELIVAAGLTYPSDTRYIEFAIDNNATHPDDVAKFATFASVIAEGQEFDTVTFDTPEQITDNKFVAVPSLVGRTIKMFFECYNAKN